MKKTKPSKNTIPLLMLLLLSTLPLAYLPIATANPTEIEILTFFAEPAERLYWDQIIAKFETDTSENPTGITVKHTYVEFDFLFDEITRLHLLGQDPDIITMHGMWLPRFSDYSDPIVTENVDPDVKADVMSGAFPMPAVEGSTYKGIVYGYPTEIDSHALVYNKALLAAAGYPNPPTNWDELKTIARAVTQRDATGAITVAGFLPYINGHEELRYEFMNLLWSNNGEFLDLTGEAPGSTFGVPRALFADAEGVEALDLYYSLNENAYPGQGTYDPDLLAYYGVGWSGWAENRIGMVVIPTWFNYIRSAMGDRFYTDIGVAPVPIGPSNPGTYPADSVCVTFNHMMAVTQKAVEKGTDTDAWTFVKWLNKPRSYGYIPSSEVGPIPRGPTTGPVSIMGDYLVFDGIIPTRTSDRANALTQDYKHLAEDPWFSGFVWNLENNGRADPKIRTAQEVQDKVGVMFDRVAELSEDPATVAAETAADINSVQPPPAPGYPGLLPAPGDVDMDGVVAVADGVLVVFDWNAVPGASNWNRGRADVIGGDDWVSAADGGLIVYNFGTIGAD